MSQSDHYHEENIQINQKIMSFLDHHQLNGLDDEHQHLHHQNVLNHQHLHEHEHEHVQQNQMNPEICIVNRNYQQEIQLMNQPNQSELDYYQEYKKIYLISYHLYLQKIKHIEIRVNCQKKIKIIEEKLKDLNEPKIDTEEQNKIKRSRRTADEIQRKFKCQVEYCQRNYGSQGSLQQHIKLKHPQLYKNYEQNNFVTLIDNHIDSYTT